VKLMIVEKIKKQNRSVDRGNKKQMKLCKLF
jgi:hypothetical protein